jgi:hypothetical protein
MKAGSVPQSRRSCRARAHAARGVIPEGSSAFVAGHTLYAGLSPFIQESA